MFSGITSYIWGAAPAAPAEAEVATAESSVPLQPLSTSSCVASETVTDNATEPCDVSAMDVVSVGSDEDILTPPQGISDDEWVVISDDEEPDVKTTHSNYKSAIIARQLEQKGIRLSEEQLKEAVINSDTATWCCAIDKNNKNSLTNQRRRIHSVKAKLNKEIENVAMMNGARNIRIDNEKQEMDKRERDQLEIQDKIQALSLPRRPTKSKLEPAVQKRQKEHRVLEAEDTKLKTDKESELAMLMEQLRPERRAKRQQEHVKLSRKFLNKSNSVRDVMSGGNSVLRRSDRLKPTSCSRANNNRKSQ